MNYLSAFSGIEAASVAWQPLGWKPVAFAEIEPFACAVLAHHYPGTPNHGDVRRHEEWPDAAIDVLAGGPPCQSFSVAGIRKGLDDPRGDLLFTFLAVARRYRPLWLVFENVPGLMSSNGGRDFGTFLGGLAELGYGFAYRILDALSSSAWPSDAVVSSLSDVLETGDHLRRYCLSARACLGILRRAAKRGKTLPAPLLLALTAVAASAPISTATAD